MGRSQRLVERYFKKDFMKEINVIDLDKTLIPYDSFRLFVIGRIKSIDVKIMFLTLLRKLRFLSASKYKEKIILTTNLTDNSKEVDKIVSMILKSINKDILELIENNSNNETFNISCSASPDIYVKIIAEHFGWKGFGSYIEQENFYHMWGEKKLKFIYNNYPPNEYIYNFAISDSESDLQLLKQFKKYELKKWTSH